VTVVGLPLAIAVFIFEQRKERNNEEEEVYQLLSDNYQEFLKIALENPDLRLFANEETPALSVEQRERMFIIFSMLISLFERAYLLLYEDDMAEKPVKALAFVGGLYGRVVQSSGFPHRTAHLAARRRPCIRSLHPESCCQ